ncbi:MAG: ABC transporter permease [Alphaproteobacteria bacterium]|nr:ABC transporter permease [Alphaproteobacteria bacterium]
MKSLLAFPRVLPQVFWAFLAAFALMLVMAAATESFAAPQNLFNIARNVSFIAIMALGVTPVLLSGGIDLSIGSVMGISAMAAGMALEAGASLGPGLAAGLSCALACGIVNGGLVAFAGFNPFIVTIAMLSALRSLDLVVANGKFSYQFGPDADLFAYLGGGDFAGVPVPAWIGLVLLAFLAFALRFRRWGRYVYAIGANEKAVHAAGVSVARVKFSVYVVSSLMAGLAGILMTGWLGGVTTSLGTGYELNVIAAAVIGGVSLAGGYGLVAGPVAGALLLEIIRNAFLMAGFNAYWQGFFVGVILLSALVLERVYRPAK